MKQNRFLTLTEIKIKLPNDVEEPDTFCRAQVVPVEVSEKKNSGNFFLPLPRKIFDQAHVWVRFENFKVSFQFTRDFHFKYSRKHLLIKRKQTNT